MKGDTFSEKFALNILREWFGDVTNILLVYEYEPL
jgi:hypothetical protein